MTHAALYFIFATLVPMLVVVAAANAGLDSVLITFTYATNQQTLCSNCVLNQTKMSNYSCSAGDDSFSASNMQKFKDPIQPGHIIVGVRSNPYY